MDGQTQILFEEVQYLRQPWVWIIVVVVTLVLLRFGAWPLLRTLTQERPIGAAGPSAVIQIVRVVLTLVALALPILLYVMNLSTQVRTDGLYVKFFPLNLSYHRLPFEGLESYQVRTYRALAEYGGWGIRYGKAGTAYIMSGNQGLELRYNNGRGVLIGSQRSEELRAAVDRLRSQPK